MANSNIRNTPGAQLLVVVGESEDPAHLRTDSYNNLPLPHPSYFSETLVNHKYPSYVLWEHKDERFEKTKFNKRLSVQIPYTSPQL